MTNNYNPPYHFSNILTNQTDNGLKKINFSQIVGNNESQPKNYGKNYRNQNLNYSPQKRNKTFENKNANKYHYQKSDQNKQIRNCNQSPLNINNNIIMKNLDKKNYNNNKLNINLKKVDEKEIKTPNPVSDFDKDLLKVFIYIYYYEKYEKILTDDNNKNIFNNGNKYFYLINPAWLKNFEIFYGYDKLGNILESIGKNYNYKNIESGIEYLVQILSKADILKKGAVFTDLKAVNKMITGLNKLKNISFTTPGKILPAKIMDIIKSWDENVKNNIKPKYFIFKFGLVYYINPDKIIVGNLNKNTALFTPKYIFTYDKNKGNPEIPKITSIPINDYIAQRKCDQKKLLQLLLNEIGKPIGSLIIIERKTPIPPSNNDLNQKGNQCNKRINDLIKKNNNFVRHINDLNKKLNEKNIENENIKKELQNLKEENVSLKKIIQDKNNEFDLYNSNEKENELNQVKAELKETQNNIKKLN